MPLGNYPRPTWEKKGKNFRLWHPAKREAKG